MAIIREETTPVSAWEAEYLTVLQNVLIAGEARQDRTGVGTRALFGAALSVDLAASGLPTMRTKRLFVRGILEELCWILRGETNASILQAKGVHFWDAWADENGSLGPVYGAQLRGVQAGRVDQFKAFVEGLADDPTSRRHIMSTWTPEDIDAMRLPPCHGLVIQGFVRQGHYLDLQVYQRSGDLFLGVPFNLLSYSVLCTLVAREVDLYPGRVNLILGDAHIYQNHVTQVMQQIGRFRRLAPGEAEPTGAELQVGKGFDLMWPDADLLSFTEYDSMPRIKAEVAV